MLDHKIFHDLTFSLLSVSLFLAIFEQLLFVSSPGSSVYRVGLSLRKVVIPVLEIEHWASFLADGEFMEGVVDKERGEVYLKRPVNSSWLATGVWHNPVIGQINLSEPGAMTVRIAPFNFTAWLLFLFLPTTLTLKNPGEPDALAASLFFTALTGAVGYGHYWFFKTNAVATIENRVRRIKKQ